MTTPNAPHNGLLGVLAYVEARIATLNIHQTTYQANPISELGIVLSQLQRLAEAVEGVIDAHERTMQTVDARLGEASTQRYAYKTVMIAEQHILRWVLGERSQKEGTDDRAG